jgi:AcrR family transcriptional regulator
VPDERPGPDGGARDRNRRRRVAQLCDAALALFLKHGIGEVTIDDIVQRARVAKGSYYRYFRDKEELVETLLQPLAEIFRGAAAVMEQATTGERQHDGFSSAYLQMGGAIAGALLHHPELLRLYLQESRGPAVGARRPVRQLADEIADRAVALGRIARGSGIYRVLDTRVVTLAIIGAAERLLYDHLTREPIGDPLAVAAALISMINEGLKPR